VEDDIWLLPQKKSIRMKVEKHNTPSAADPYVYITYTPKSVLAWVGSVKWYI